MSVPISDYEWYGPGIVAVDEDIVKDSSAMGRLQSIEPMSIRDPAAGMVHAPTGTESAEVMRDEFDVEIFEPGDEWYDRWCEGWRDIHGIEIA